jgi:hypothetical protein
MSDVKQNQPMPTSKVCIQCSKSCTLDQFTRKQWRRSQPSCRLCAAFTAISVEKSRQCNTCKVVVPRIQFNIHQWGKGTEALCHCCRNEEQEELLASIPSVGTNRVKNLPDGTTVCLAHSSEHCAICKMSFTLPNKFARERNALGRDLTEDETTRIIEADPANIIHRKICIMDGMAMCPRSGRKLRCPCNEVTYCSPVCQKHHWTIHKMTCKTHIAQKKAKAERKAAKNAPKAAAASQTAHGLTEEQLEYIRIEAFMAENSGHEHSIEECAWQLGEHPLTIGGGSIRMSANGSLFVKGDVAKIYMEGKSVQWDGSPRFGLPPYVQQKPPEDWIARALREKP